MRPVRDPAFGEFERESHDRAPSGRDPGIALHASRGSGCLLEEPFEVAGDGTGGTCRVQGSSHLTGDFTFSDHDRFETTRDSEKVLSHGIV